jgi:hypothetical protein
MPFQTDSWRSEPLGTPALWLGPHPPVSAAFPVPFEFDATREVPSQADEIALPLKRSYDRW